MNRRIQSTHVPGNIGRHTFLLQLCCAAALLFALAQTVAAQTAYISDAWWTFQQDCDGDLAFAGTLLGNVARLNWAPAVVNCNGTLTVAEIISRRTCGSGTWTPIFTNAPH